jgi:hypothetical protein
MHTRVYYCAIAHPQAPEPLPIWLMNSALAGDFPFPASLGKGKFQPTDWTCMT